MGKSLHRTKTTVVYNQQSDILRLEVVPAGSIFKPRAGQHYYLYQPFRLKGWENHPFTLGAWETSRSASQAPESPQSEKNDENVLASSVAASATLNDGVGSKTLIQDHQPLAAGETRLIFWVRPNEGWTRSLRNLCQKSPDNTSSTDILIEGPYGKFEPLWKFSDVLLIAGGSGIAAMVPYLLDHEQRAPLPSTNCESQQTRTRTITLIWANKTACFMRSVAGRELKTILARNDVHVEFYATEENSMTEVSNRNRNIASSKDTPSRLEDSELSLVLPAASENEGIAVSYGRPDIRADIRKAAGIAQEAGNRLAVMACGPPGVAGAARAAAHDIMRGSNNFIEYFEEVYGW
jgi:ferredoxin-NADP reductase